MSFQLTSTAFHAGQTIPKRHTGDGDDLSPPLKWTDPPAGTKSLALICDDPDAPRGTWTHWIALNIPADWRELAEGVQFPSEVIQTTTDFGTPGYGGPAPPPGMPHRYFFRLYALNRPVDLDADASIKQVHAAIQANAIGMAELMGMYGR
jgi:Raf kinase inhibitor-like YbhB/YbcL family protein